MGFFVGSLHRQGMAGRTARFRAGRQPWTGDAPPEGGPQAVFRL